MEKIQLNKIWDGFKWIWKELESSVSVSQEKEINFDSTRIFGSDLANLIAKRLERRQQQSGGNQSLVLTENDLLPFSFFQTGLNAGKSVCCIVRRITQPQDLDKLIDAAKNEQRLQLLLHKWYDIDPTKEPDRFKNQAPKVYLPYASGFLVGGDYLLTNRHVVEEKDKLGEFRAVFKYEADSDNQKTDPELLAGLAKYEFNDEFWVTSSNPELDYVLLKLNPLDGESVSVPFDKVDLAKTLEGEVAPSISKDTLDKDSELREKLAELQAEFVNLVDKKPVDGDPIHMIQHPGGRPKQVVVFNNRLVDVYENFIRYKTEAQPGSSGSPLFNTEWQVVGIHQAAILNINDNSGERKVTGYLGIRMDSILADLRKQSSSNSQLQDFLDTYVDRRKDPKKQVQKIFILAGRKRDLVLGKKDAELERIAMENLLKSIFTEMQSLAPNVGVVSILGNPAKPDKEALKLAIQDINKQRNPQQQGELAIELLVDQSGIAKNRPFSIKLYYYAGKSGAEKLALSLQKALKQNRDFPLLEVSPLPDNWANTRGLDFCQKVNLPAVVIFVGDLDNPGDRQFLEKLQKTPTAGKSLAQNIIQGLQDVLSELNKT